MPWWGWMGLGFFLIGAELFGVDAAFYLIFVGFAGVVMGALGLVGVDLPDWAQWIGFAVVALASMVLFRQKLYDRLRGDSPGYQDPLIGEAVTVAEQLDPGGRTRVNLRGSVWTAVNVGEIAIPAGSAANVVAKDGTVLNVQPTTSSSSSESN